MGAEEAGAGEADAEGAHRHEPPPQRRHAAAAASATIARLPRGGHAASHLLCVHLHCTEHAAGRERIGGERVEREIAITN